MSAIENADFNSLGPTAAVALVVLLAPASALDVLAAEMLRCPKSGELSLSAWPPDESDKAFALRKGVRLPWTGSGGVPSVSGRRQFTIVQGRLVADDPPDGAARGEYSKGGTGDDYMVGGPGLNVYAFDVGDGHDVVRDSGGPNVLSFSADVALEQIQAQLREDGVMVVRCGATDQIAIEGYSKSTGWFIESSCGGDALPLEAVILAQKR